jgi:predicted ATPase/class 3 adenylate cyclase
MSGSTALGERVDAESVQELLRSYFGEMRGVVERHGGTVEKFIGDAVVAGFGLHEAHEDDALRACRAALEMQERIVALNSDLVRRFGASIAVRIGVNTGEVVTGGAMNAETFATGDAVNVAARLEQGARPGEVLLGETTYRLVRDAVKVEAREPLAAKGKSEPLTVCRLVSVETSGTASRGLGTPLAGRTAELALLEGEFDAAVAERRCRLATVLGEPGVGKSRLIAELVVRVGSRARVVRGACLSYGEGITYWAVGQIVRELAGIESGDLVAEARARIEACVAGIADGAEVAARIEQLLALGEGSASAEEMTWAIRRFLAAEARERPLVVLVDDIHWAEPAFHELLAGLPATLGEMPLLVVCAARPELLEGQPGWDVTVQLEPLDQQDVDTLVESLLGDAPAGVRERLARASAGNPLFAEELVGMLIDEGLLRRDGESWKVEGDLEQIALPVSLSALLGARLDRLDRASRDALERGAVEGELFHGSAVIELSDPASRPSVPAQLEALTHKNLIRLAAATLAGPTAFRFKHILFRDAAYRATAKKLRATLHAQYATWLESVAGGRVAEVDEILGYHLEQAYRYHTELAPLDDDTRALGERAAGHLSVASRRAGVRGDYRAAAKLLERALALGIADPSRRAHGQFELAGFLGGVGRGAEMGALVAGSLAAAIRLGDRGLAARARVKRAASTVFTGDPDPEELRRVAEEAIDTLTELGDQRGLAEAYQFYGQSFVREGRMTKTLAAYERALAAAKTSGNQSTCRSVISSTAYVLAHGPTPVEEATSRCEEMIRANAFDRVLEATVTRCLAALVAMAGLAGEALELVERSGRVLDELDILNASTTWRDAAAEAREYAGDRAGAKRELEAKWLGLEAVRHRPSDPQAAIAAYRLALLYCDDGCWDAAERCLAYGAEVPFDAAYGREAAVRLAGRARIASDRGRHDEAVTSARKAVELLEQNEWLNLKARICETLAEVQRAAGNSREADAAVARALFLYEEKGNIAAATALQAAAAKA